MTDAPAPSSLICVGALAGAFGVKGEVRLKSFCADPGAIADYAPLSLEDGRSFTLKITRPLNGGYAARLSGIATREQAEALKGQRLYAPRDRLPEPGDDEFYHADLIGLEVVDTGGVTLGRVRAVFDHGAGDILEIIGPPIPGTMLLPFTRAVFPTVSLETGRLIADPPDEQDTPDRTA